MRSKYEYQPSRIIIADPFFPGEPWCSGCGEADRIRLAKDGEWECERCGKRFPVTTGEYRRS